MAPRNSPVVVHLTAYEVRLCLPDRRVIALTPDEAQALAMNLIAAIRTIVTMPLHDCVVH